MINIHYVFVNSHDFLKIVSILIFNLISDASLVAVSIR